MSGLGVVYRQTQVYSVKLHQATRLHYDLRLAYGDVAKSFVLPKGPTIDPFVRRQAILVDDHRTSGLFFEGVYPEGMKGAGPSLLWDGGAYRHTTKIDGRAVVLPDALDNGRITFELRGRRLRGGFELARAGRDPLEWLFTKLPDEWAEVGEEVTEKETGSILTGRDLRQVLADGRKGRRKRTNPYQLALPFDLD